LPLVLLAQTNLVTRTQTSTSPHQKAQASIFPNPVTDRFNFDTGDKLVELIRVTDINGRIVEEEKPRQAQAFGTVNLPPIPTGIYSVNFSYDVGTTDIYLLVVKQ
jgi:hypothetical protein